MIGAIFNHIVKSDNPDVLKRIREQDLNGVVYESTHSSRLQNYLKSLTSENVKLLPKEAYSYQFAVFDEDYDFQKSDNNQNRITQLLSDVFPKNEGFEEFCKDVKNTIDNFCEATGHKGASFTLYFSKPAESGVWHQDARNGGTLDVRGFKAYISDGALIRDNKTIKSWDPNLKSFGRVTATQLSNGTASQLTEGDFGIWKGNKHEKPLVHARPEVTEGELRLSMTIDPR